MEAKLVKAGWVPMSPWWKKTLADAYASGKRVFPVQVGRRGGKSTTFCRVACFEAVHGEHVVPPGDTGFFALISAEKPQAKERLKTCGAILRTLGVQHKETAEEIIISRTGDAAIVDDVIAQPGQMGIKCFTASLQGVVSFTCIGALCDEEARWRDKESGANPAKEVVGTLTPTMATQPKAKAWHVSAPWAELGLHWDLVSAGTNRHQTVYVAPTWVANPTITEEMTYELEPDEQTRLREYGAVAMGSDESKFFSLAAIKRAQSITHTYSEPERVIAGGDFAFRRDATAWVIGDVHDAVTIGASQTGRRTRVLRDQERLPMLDQPLVPGETIQEALADTTLAGGDSMCCDLHYIETVREELEGSDVALVEFPGASKEIERAYVHTRVLMAKGLLDLRLASPTLIDQLKNTVATPTDGAGLSIKNKRIAGRHGDSVSALVCLIYASTREAPGKRIAGGQRPFGNGDGKRRFPRGHDGKKLDGVGELTDHPPQD